MIANSHEHFHPSEMIAKGHMGCVPLECSGCNMFALLLRALHGRDCNGGGANF